MELNLFILADQHCVDYYMLSNHGGSDHESEVGSGVWFLLLDKAHYL
jgi:hypothetical protein